MTGILLHRPLYMEPWWTMSRCECWVWALMKDQWRRFDRWYIRWASCYRSHCLACDWLSTRRSNRYSYVGQGVVEYFGSVWVGRCGVGTSRVMVAAWLGTVRSLEMGKCGLQRHHGVLTSKRCAVDSCSTSLWVSCAQQVFVAEYILVTPMSFLYGSRFVGPFTPLVFSLRQVHSFFNFSWVKLSLRHYSGTLCRAVRNHQLAISTIQHIILWYLLPSSPNPWHGPSTLGSLWKTTTCTHPFF